MGWKAVKTHYGIVHIVQISGDDLHIGAPYVTDMLIVKPDGEVVVNFDARDERIHRIVTEMRADPAKLVELMAAKDEFAKSIPVYAAINGKIVQHLCEKLDWPNVTHDGQLMYENHFFADPADAVAHGLAESRAHAEYLERDITRIEGKLLEANADLARVRGNVASYESMSGAASHVHDDACGCKPAS